jgi:hypothetical protein
MTRDHAEDGRQRSRRRRSPGPTGPPLNTPSASERPNEDGFSALWFDDVDQTLFTYPVSVVVERKTIVEDFA